MDFIWVFFLMNVFDFKPLIFLKFIGGKPSPGLLKETFLFEIISPFLMFFEDTILFLAKTLIDISSFIGKILFFPNISKESLIDFIHLVRVNLFSENQ